MDDSSPKTRVPRTKDGSEGVAVRSGGHWSTRGFEDAGQQFDHQTRDSVRLGESIRLQQAFAALESQSDRNQLLALAEQLSTQQS